MSTVLADWSKTATAGELAEGLALLFREWQQRQNGEPESVSPPPESPGAPTLSVKEASALIGVSTGRVYALVREGRIGGAIHVGQRQVRFERSGLEAWLRSGGEAQE